MSSKKFILKTLYDALWSTSTGSLRRKAIIRAMYQSALIDNYAGSYISSIPVNGKWQLSSKDPDLKILLKKKLLVRDRSGTRRNRGHSLLGWKNSSKRQTELFLGDPVLIKSFLGEFSDESKE